MSNTWSPNNAQNDDQRFEQLVEQYQEEVLRICFLYLSDQTLAEDAVQETFLKVYRSMGTFRGNCSEKTWIMKIAMHACYDINRSGWFRMMNRRIPRLLQCLQHIECIHNRHIQPSFQKMSYQIFTIFIHLPPLTDGKFTCCSVHIVKFFLLVYNTIAI